MSIGSLQILEEKDSRLKILEVISEEKKKGNINDMSSIYSVIYLAVMVLFLLFMFLKKGDKGFVQWWKSLSPLPWIVIWGNIIAIRFANLLNYYRLLHSMENYKLDVIALVIVFLIWLIYLFMLLKKQRKHFWIAVVFFVLNLVIYCSI